MGKLTVASKCPLIDIEDVKMAFNCPLKLEQLQEVVGPNDGRAEVANASSTSSADPNRKFFCAHCDRHVFEVSTLEELNARAKHGDCVTFLSKEKVPSAQDDPTAVSLLPSTSSYPPWLPTAASKMFQSRIEPQHRINKKTRPLRLFMLFLVLAVCAFVFHVLSLGSSPSESSVLSPPRVTPPERMMGRVARPIEHHHEEPLVVRE